ncbi:MAG: hypothetical protein AB7Q37_19005, partial [Pyrinomonadaceae bacterium]
ADVGFEPGGKYTDHDHIDLPTESPTIFDKIQGLEWGENNGNDFSSVHCIHQSVHLSGGPVVSSWLTVAFGRDFVGSFFHTNGWQRSLHPVMNARIARLGSPTFSNVPRWIVWRWTPTASPIPNSAPTASTVESTPDLIAARCTPDRPLVAKRQASDNTVTIQPAA